jgi:hypothetical protein
MNQTWTGYVQKRLERETVMKLFGWVTILAALIGLPEIASSQSPGHTFPRIGAYEIAGASRSSDPAYRDALAKHDIVIMGLWRNWSGQDTVTGAPLNIRDVVVDIKRRAANKGNGSILLGKYTIYNESYDTRRNAAQRDRFDKLSSETGPGYRTNNDWWARNASGTNTSSFPGTWHTNVTDFVKRDRDGYTWTEWATLRDYNEFFKPVPEFDIWFIDNWFFQPRVTADWNGDGKNDGKGETWVREEFRKGMMRAARHIRKLAPNVIIMGNVDGDPNRKYGMLTDPEYKGQIDSLYEGAIGRSYSQEGHTSWHSMMEQYQLTLANSRNGILVMTVHGDPDDYAEMRYGLASCLMDDGYFYYTSSELHYKSAYWYDEFDVDLGRAVDPPQRSAWRDGVYRRRFENGMVLVNPKGNGTRTVQIEPGYKRIKGNQDKVTNNGQPVSSVTLRERGGLILLKEGASNSPPAPPPARPKPPVLDN